MTVIENLRSYISQPIPIAPLVLFRGAFGVLMLWSIIRFAHYGWIESLYLDPEFYFSYYGFEWIEHPGTIGIYALFLLTALSSLGILFGFFFRLSASVFFVCFTYIELLDKANYLNHYYFVSLISLALIFLPAHHSHSLDVLWRGIKKHSHVPRWPILWLQLMVGGLYFMAGVAKLNPDWIVHALPMRIWLPPHASTPLIGSLLDEAWVAYFFSWAGVLYDLCIPFLLYFSITRGYAYVSIVIFHALTALLFPIGIFPYLMMSISLIFLDPMKSARILNLGRPIEKNWNHLKSTYRATYLLKGIARPAGMMTLFLIFLFPLRGFAYQGNIFWHEQGYRFAWRVMLMEKAGHCFFYVQDPTQKGELEIDNRAYLTPNQEKQMCTQPDMILQFAKYIEADFKAQGIKDPIVRVEAWVTLNGRGSRLYIDPFVDLTTLEDDWFHREWVLPYDSVITSQDLRIMKQERKTPN